MSVQFGVWNVDGPPVDERLACAADPILAEYAPDGASHYQSAEILIAHHALHTTAESCRETQPYIAGSGAVITWDGRLDNREELIYQLGERLSELSTDVEIVAESFDRWDTNCFAKLLGDWAISVWRPSSRTLILAKDFAGIRPLYYSAEASQIVWSSLLEPLVTLFGRKFELNHAYVAGWLSMYPAADATPYVGIHGVPPSSFVTLDAKRAKIVKYWDFDPSKQLQYRTDSEYEEHFRALFRKAVHRRLRSDRPICAELSGGMDSPSIVCMADLIAASSPGIPEIRTLSYYDDTEPNADERPYFTKVEAKRGRIGCHIDSSGIKMFAFDSTGGFLATPGNVSSGSKSFTLQRTVFLNSCGTRVVLSGVGGDEVTGGIPSPVTELQDLLIQGNLRTLAHKLKLWALAKRKPWFHLLGEAIVGFLPSAMAVDFEHLRPLECLKQDFVHRNSEVFSGFHNRVRLLGPRPSFQANIQSLNFLRRQLATKSLPGPYSYETRYPFLDRDLLEFIFAIPRDQLLQPGYRRSLMRRALATLVPPEILQRKRKAYLSRSPRTAIANEWESLKTSCTQMVSARLGIVDETALQRILLACRNSDQVPLAQLMRTILLEIW